MTKMLTLPVAAILFFSAAEAQSMDYGAIAQLFGEPGTTSATGSPQRVADVPANMSIVTEDEIRRSGGRDVPSILRHVVGVDVLQWANDDFDVSARGYNQAYSARTLVLVNGRQVYADSFGFTPWSAVPVELDSISQIEIVKGPNAALFGFNAVAGVINIITKNPRYNDSSAISLRYGSQNLGEASGQARIALSDDVFVRVSGGYRNDKPFGTSNPLGVDGVPHGRNQRASIDADAVFVLPQNIELELDATHSEAKQNEVSGGYKLQTSEYKTNSVLGRATADTALGLFKLSGYNNWFDWTRLVGPGGTAPKLSNTVTVVQAEDLFSVFTDHTIRIAGEYRHNEVETRDRSDGWIAFDAASASAMWNWQIRPNLSWTGALRFDSVAYDSVLAQSITNRVGPSLHINEWNFNAGLVWNVTPSDTVRLLAARGVQLPNLVQVWDTAAGQGAVSPGTPTPLHLQPSTVSNFEILWNRQFTSIDARLQIGAFHQDTYDVLSIGSGTIDTAGSPGMPPANVGSSRADGLEVGLNGQLTGNWRWQASYRFEAINDKYTKSARADLINYEDTTPQHVVKAGLGWDGYGWETDMFLNYQSNSAGLRRVWPQRVLVPIGAFVSFDARIAYKFSDYMTLAVSGQNLFQGAQQQTSGPEVQRQFFVTLSVEN
jgi:iron complex outermembrane receptor protein